MNKTLLTLALASLLGLAACSEPANDDSSDPESNNQELTSEELRSQLEVSGDASDPATVRTHEQEHAELQQTLRQYLQRREADSRDQCALIAYGHKPCGGPESYIVYSQKGMGEDTIEELEAQVKRYNELDAFIKSSRNIVGNCQVTPEPEIEFENGRCMANLRSGNFMNQ